MTRELVEDQKPVPHLLQRASFLCLRARHADALAVAKEALEFASTGADEDKAANCLQAKCLIQMGAAQSASGNPADAIGSLRRALKKDPVAVDALMGLAVVLKASDAIHIPEVTQLLREAHAIDPANGEVRATLATLLTEVGVRLKQSGLPASAIEYYEDAVNVMPGYGQAFYNLGVAHADAKNPGKAEVYYKKCIEVQPSHVEAWCNLGVLQMKTGRVEESLKSYGNALKANPNFGLAKQNFASALVQHATAIKEAGGRKAAKGMYKRALAVCPHLGDAHYLLGVTYSEEGKLRRALTSYSLAVAFNPQLSSAHNSLGSVHKSLGNLDRALECYKEALAVDDTHHVTHNNLAILYTMMGHIEPAQKHLDAACKHCPGYTEALNNKGVLLRDLGDVDAAIRQYEETTAVDAGSDMAGQNRLHALNYSERWTKKAVFDEHQKWGGKFQTRIDAEVAAAADRSPKDTLAVRVQKWAKDPPRPDPKIPRGPGTQRPLRVAYISPDFFTHSVSYFAEVLLANHSPKCVTVFAYSNTTQEDGKTEMFKQYPNLKGRWRNIWGMSSVEVANLIIADEIDVLVELAGHTANNRLDVMALRLAPLQITWIGYPNTTGLDAIHYRVTDATVDPEETSQRFTEKLWRLPGSFLCYTPSVDAPEKVASPPSEHSGGIVTFGSFNVLSKCQTRTIKLWASILKRVPNSRFLIKAKPLGSPRARARVEGMFASHGIPASRLDLVPLIPATRSHLEAYSNIDVALDPFPYAGTTTTCEALYMGVPVISMGVKADAGDHAHNVGVSLLTSIGHPELIAWDDDEYVRKAVKLATDLPRLKRLREGMRADMMASPLGDAKTYIENVETMLLDMWEERGGKTGRTKTEGGKEKEMKEMTSKDVSTHKRSTEEFDEKRVRNGDEPKTRRRKSEAKPAANGNGNGVCVSPKVGAEVGPTVESKPAAV